MKIQSCYGSWLSTFAWVLSLMVCFMIPQLHADAPPSKPSSLKSPADAAVTFELADTDHNLSLCSGARFSHAEIATSQTCMVKLKTHIDAGSGVHAISSHGEDYGEIRLPDFSMKEAATAGTEAPQLAIVMLTAPTETDVLWPAIHIDETAIDSTVTAHRAGEDEDNLHKRSVASQFILGSCEGELCTIHNDSDTQHLNDGEPVFQNKRLFCVISQNKHCLRTRSLVTRQSSNCVETSRVGSIVQYDCKECSGQQDDLPDVGQLPNCNGGASCTISYTGSIRDTNCNYWYNSPVAIAGFAIAGFLLICVASCTACTLCICCGCSACCQSCALCAKSKTTVNNKLQMQQMN